MEKYPPYQSIFAKLSYGESQMLDKAFYEEEVKRLCLAFEQQVYLSVPSIIIFASCSELVKYLNVCWIFLYWLMETKLEVIVLEGSWLAFNVFDLFLCKLFLIFISKMLYFVTIAVSLCCVLRIYEVKGTGDQELNVDFRMCCSESEVQSSWQCCLHILVGWLVIVCMFVGTICILSAFSIWVVDW